MALLRSVATVGSYTLVSRILGFARDMLTAAYLGAGPVMDAFVVAFRLPNFFRSLFAEGAFNAAFVPLFSRIHTRDGHGPARDFAEQALTILVIILFVFVTACQIFMPWFMLGLAPGFAGDPAKFDLAVLFTRITFPYLLFISLVSLLGGVLNSLGRFAAVAATPILLNLTMIAVLVPLAHVMQTPGHALAWGVMLSGITQFLWLAWACWRADMHLRLVRPRLSPEIRRLLALILPAAIGAGVVQVNLIVGQMIASLLPTGAISYLYYADRLNQLPIGVIGVAVGTALLPLLSRQIAGNDAEAALQSQNRAIEMALFLALPATAAFLTVSHELIAVLFERGEFAHADTGPTARTLFAYSLGLPAYVLVRALQPGFYARHDTSTPVRIAMICIAINIGLSFALLHSLQYVGLAVATAVSSWTNTFLLGVTLYRRGQLKPDARLKDKLRRMLAATIIMGGGLLLLAWLLRDWFAGHDLYRFAALVILVAGGGALYGFTAIALGAIRMSELKAMLRRRPAATAPMG